MPDLNSVALTGRIAEEPKLIERGVLRVARLRLVVETVRRDRDSGDLVPRLHHFNVAVFGNPAPEAARLPVGSHVSVRGQLSHSTLRDQGGSERESIEVTTAEWVRPLGRLDGGTQEAATSAESIPRPEPRRPHHADTDVLDW